MCEGSILPVVRDNLPHYMLLHGASVYLGPSSDFFGSAGIGLGYGLSDYAEISNNFDPNPPFWSGSRGGETIGQAVLDVKKAAESHPKASDAKDQAYGLHVIYGDPTITYGGHYEEHGEMAAEAIKSRICRTAKRAGWTFDPPNRYSHPPRRYPDQQIFTIKMAKRNQ